MVSLDPNADANEQRDTGKGHSEMKKAVLLAVMGVAGCGVIYTSPDVYQADNAAFNATTDFDVNVVPLTYATAAEANMAPYVPARLPSAFRPQPAARLPGIGSGSARMPNLPSASPTWRPLRKIPSAPVLSPGRLPGC